MICCLAPYSHIPTETEDPLWLVRRLQCGYVGKCFDALNLHVVFQSDCGAGMQYLPRDLAGQAKGARSPFNDGINKRNFMGLGAPKIAQVAGGDTTRKNL